MTSIERMWSANFEDGGASGERPPLHRGTEWRRRWAAPAAGGRAGSSSAEARRPGGELRSPQRARDGGSPGPSPGAGGARLALGARILRGFAAWLERRAVRAQERRMLHDLARLDDHALRDIGLDRADLQGPILRPFRSQLDR